MDSLVSYSLSCTHYGKNSEHVIFSQKYMWHNTMKIWGILFQVYYFQVSVVWVWRSIVKRIPRINCLPWLKAVWRFRWVLRKYRQHAGSIRSSNFVVFGQLLPAAFHQGWPKTKWKFDQNWCLLVVNWSFGFWSPLMK